jgi:dipeptide/tripeptide permease
MNKIVFAFIDDQSMAFQHNTKNSFVNKKSSIVVLFIMRYAASFCVYTPCQQTPTQNKAIQSIALPFLLVLFWICFTHLLKTQKMTKRKPKQEQNKTG